MLICLNAFFPTNILADRPPVQGDSCFHIVLSLMNFISVRSINVRHLLYLSSRDSVMKCFLFVDTIAWLSPQDMDKFRAENSRHGRCVPSVC
jgi:hypothetical protein